MMFAQEVAQGSHVICRPFSWAERLTVLQMLCKDHHFPWSQDMELPIPNISGDGKLQNWHCSCGKCSPNSENYLLRVNMKPESVEKGTYFRSLRWVRNYFNSFYNVIQFHTIAGVFSKCFMRIMMLITSVLFYFKKSLENVTENSDAQKKQAVF